jgi:hypothetical protein
MIFILGRKISAPLYAVKNLQRDSMLLVNNARKLLLSLESNDNNRNVEKADGIPGAGAPEETGAAIAEEAVSAAPGDGSIGKREAHIAGTEEVCDIAGQIDKIAARLEKGIKAFKL